MTSLLVLTNMYPPHHYGGYELSCFDVVERLRKRGHDVTVLTTSMRLPGVPDDPAEDGLVRRELRFYWEDHELVSPSIAGRIAVERHNQRVLDRVIDSTRPDVVSVWNMGALSLGLLTTLVERQVSLVYVVCGDWLAHGVAMDPWARLFVRRPRLARAVRALTGLPTALPDLGAAGAFCFISDALRVETAAMTPWRYAISTVTYSGINGRLFRADEGEQERPWRGRLLYSGRLDSRKGIDTAVRALAHLPSAQLEINGRGDSAERARLQALARELGIADRVRFADDAREDLPARYRDADVVVFPSTWPEPFGLVPLEAMACGTPVVASGTGGSGEYLRDGDNCLLYEPGDDEALAATVARVESDPVQRARMVAGGRRTASELDVDRLTDVLEQWHRAAAAGFADGVPPDRPRPTADVM